LAEKGHISGKGGTMPDPGMAAADDTTLLKVSRGI